MRALTAVLFWNLVEGYFILTGFSYPPGSTPSQEPLRGLERGNIWSPPIKGANKVQCGGLQDLARTYGKRVEVTAGNDFQVSGDIIDSHGLGELSFQIKYGDTPDFTWSPGFTMSGNGEFSFPTNFSVVAKQVMPGSYTGLATIQVTYTAGTLAYFQCIDVIVKGEQPLPGSGVTGFGPVELAALNQEKILNTGVAGAVLEDSGLSDFHISLIVLVPFVCLVFVFLGYRARCVDESVDENSADINHHQLPPEPTFTKTKKSSSGSNKPSPHTKQTNPGTTRTTPSQSDRKDNSDSKNDSADPRGAHFHFQYI